jgi:hypothetical protein
LRLREDPFFLHMITALGFHAEEASCTKLEAVDKRKRYPTRLASGGVGMWVGGLAIISLVIVIFLGQGEGKRKDGGLQQKKEERHGDAN